MAILLGKHQLIYLIEDHKHWITAKPDRIIEKVYTIYLSPMWLKFICLIYFKATFQWSNYEEKKKLFLNVIEHTCVLVCPNFPSCYKTWLIQIPLYSAIVKITWK